MLTARCTAMATFFNTLYYYYSVFIQISLLPLFARFFSQIDSEAACVSEIKNREKEVDSEFFPSSLASPIFLLAFSSLPIL